MAHHNILHCEYLDLSLAVRLGFLHHNLRNGSAALVVGAHIPSVVVIFVAPAIFIIFGPLVLRFMSLHLLDLLSLRFQFFLLYLLDLLAYLGQLGLRRRTFALCWLGLLCNWLPLRSSVGHLLVLFGGLQCQLPSQLVFGVHSFILN